MWFGTRNGLSRYDGNSFKIFKPGKGNSISSEWINDIVEDSSGKIWVATMEGLNSYDPASNSWENFMPNREGAIRGLPSYIVRSLYIDKNNLLWIVPDVYELTSYNIADKKFTHYNWPAYIKLAFPNLDKKYRTIQKVIPKSANELWLGTNIGLFLFDISKAAFSFKGCGFEGDIIDLKYDASNKLVYLSSQDSGFFCYNENNGSYQKIQLVPEPYPSATFNRKKLQDKPLWIASTLPNMRFSTSVSA